MNFDTEWGLSTCNPTKRVIRNIVVWVSVVVFIVSTSVVVGFVAYKEPLWAVAAFAIAAVYTFGVWLSYDDCPEEGQ